MTVAAVAPIHTTRMDETAIEEASVRRTTQKASPPQPRRRREPARVRRPKLGPAGRSHHPSRQHEPVRLTRRGVLAGWLVAALSVGLIAFGLAQAFQPLAPQAESVQSVTVLPGQTLWGIARTTNPTVDPRVTVEAIREANGLARSSPLLPGTELAVPVYADP